MRCQHTPMSTDKFVDPYVTAFAAVVDALTVGKPKTNLISGSTFPFTQDTARTWSAFAFVLRLLPHEYLKPGGRSRIDLSHIVAVHLHDTGPRAYPFCILINISPDVFIRVRGCPSMFCLPPSAVRRRPLVN